MTPEPTKGQSKQSTAEISQSETTQLTMGSEHPISADRMDTGGGNMLFPPPSPDAAFRNQGLFPPSHSQYPPSRENGDAEQGEDIYEEDRQVRLVPGHPRALPEDRTLKLLARAKGKVRRVPGLGTAVREPLIERGTVVRFRSPLFGVVEADVLEDKGVGIWIFHPVTERESFIPNEWLLDGQEGSHGHEHR